MRLFGKRKIEKLMQEQDDRDVQWLKDRVTEMEATTGEHSCAHCFNASDYSSRKGTFHCILAQELIVGATGDKDVVYRKWDKCDGFCPKKRCDLCEHYDPKTFTRHLADDAAIHVLPDSFCKNFKKSEALSGWPIDKAVACVNFKYKGGKND